ncbi:hypothetical protein [Algisphaera agarilytica]|uniref:Uncharacterized protein n=1 Tax=Algisphaera agarilytica TaxID=1385975 RepID=A0A7X0H7G4_9BACT|nr:hypothetical protein [Algisphaera agarilytica]MBB6429234.1 hypothetical protein [Algisphaera agarilytica]
MPWSGFPLQVNDEWASLVYLDQISAAFAERVTAMDPPGFTVSPLVAFAAGDVLADRLADYQTGVEGLVFFYGRWLDHIAHSVQDVTTYVEAMTDLPGTFRRFMPRTISDVGDSGTSGERAYLGVYNSEDNGRADSASSDIYEHDGVSWTLSADQVSPVSQTEAAGKIQAGDRLGYWLVNDLYTMLNLVHTCRIQLRLATVERYTGQANGEASEAAAIAAAEEDYAQVIAPTYVGTGGVDALAFASLTRSGSSYDALISRVTRLVRETFGPSVMLNSSLSHIVEFFGVADEANNDRQGSTAGQVRLDGEDIYTPRWRPSLPLDMTNGEPVGGIADTSSTPPNWPTLPASGNASDILQWTGGDELDGLITFSFEYNDGLPGGGLT